MSPSCLLLASILLGAARAEPPATADDGPAPAAEPRQPRLPLRWALGAETGVNDPLQVQRGLVAGFDWGFTPWFAAGIDAAWHPHTGRGWTALQSQLVSEFRLTGDLSPIYGRLQATARVTPLRHSHGAWGSALSLTAGVGVVHTVDDNEAAGFDDDDPVFAETARQWHPAPGFGLAGEVTRGPLGLRLAIERVAYVEQVASIDDEQKAHIMARVQVILHP